MDIIWWNSNLNRLRCIQSIVTVWLIANCVMIGGSNNRRVRISDKRSNTVHPFNHEIDYICFIFIATTTVCVCVYWWALWVLSPLIKYGMKTPSIFILCEFIDSFSLKKNHHHLKTVDLFKPFVQLDTLPCANYGVYLVKTIY